jgi:hypothetical protein
MAINFRGQEAIAQSILKKELFSRAAPYAICLKNAADVLIIEIDDVSVD